MLWSYTLYRGCLSFLISLCLLPLCDASFIGHKNPYIILKIRCLLDPTWRFKAMYILNHRSCNINFGANFFRTFFLGTFWLLQVSSAVVPIHDSLTLVGM